MHQSTDMNKTENELTFDLTLTPQNAGKRGYVWAGDFVYSEEITPDLANIAGLVEQEGYKLGAARTPETENDRGLYRPLVRPGV